MQVGNDCPHLILALKWYDFASFGLAALAGFTIFHGSNGVGDFVSLSALCLDKNEWPLSFSFAAKVGVVHVMFSVNLVAFSVKINGRHR